MNFPIGGEREPVYDYMRGFGFVMSSWSDKVWDRADGLQVRIFGCGSMARIFTGSKAENASESFPLGELGAHLASRG